MSDKKIIDFSEEKAKANGEITAKGLIENLLDEIEKGNIETIVYVVKHKNGEVHLGNNRSPDLEVLGLLECGKSYIIDSMYE